MVKLFFTGRQRYLFFTFSFLPIILLISSCSNEPTKANLKNYYRNDLESYEGWLGISGFNLNTKDSHSGTHCIETNSIDAVYSLTFSRKLADLSKSAIKKFELSLWVKTSDAASKGAYILSIETGPKTLAYFSFAAESVARSTDQWYQLKGIAQLPKNLSQDGILKIYFWNKGQSPILVDDFEFSFEN